jgi:hypothetical protein
MSMIATLLQDLRPKYPSMLDSRELRGSRYGLFDKGKLNANSPKGIVTSEVIEMAMRSWGRNVDISVMSPIASNNGTGLTCTVTGTEAISDILNLTWVTVSNGFEMQPAKNKMNEISYEQEFLRKYTDMVRKIATSADAATYTALNTAITPAAQYASSYVGAGNKYTFTANAMQVSLANRPAWWNEIEAIMLADDIEPSFDVLMSTNGRAIINPIFNQGAGNSVNTQYAFTNGNFNYSYSNRLTLSAACDATMFIMPEGSYAILNRNSNTCLEGLRSSDGVEFGIAYDPMLGVNLDTVHKSTCGSIVTESGNASDLASVRQYFGFAMHYAIVTPYTNYASSGISSVIRKADFLKV